MKNEEKLQMEEEEEEDEKNERKMVRLDDRIYWQLSQQLQLEEGLCIVSVSY